MKRLAGIICMLALAGCAAIEPTASQRTGWAGAWGASPTIPPAGGKAFENQTVRQIVRLSTGGSAVRIRFTNEYSDKPLDIGAATIAVAGADGKPTGETLALTFGGKASVAIPASAPLLSDPVALSVKALDSLSISIFLPTATGPCTCHFAGTATSYLSPPRASTPPELAPASTSTASGRCSPLKAGRRNVPGKASACCNCACPAWISASGPRRSASA